MSGMRCLLPFECGVQINEGFCLINHFLCNLPKPVCLGKYSEFKKKQTGKDTVSSLPKPSLIVRHQRFASIMSRPFARFIRVMAV